MAVSARKHTVPAEGEMPRFEAINDLAASINDVVPVANETERAQVVSYLQADGQGPSASRPLYVHRANSAAAFEYSTDGSAWQSVGGIERFGSPTAGPGTSTAGSALYQTADLGTAPYDRLVIAWAAVYGTPAAGSVWDGALSIGASQVDDAQVLARFTAGSSGTVFMQYQTVVSAGAQPLVRTWHRFSSGGAMSRSAEPRYSYIRGIAIAL